MERKAELREQAADLNEVRQRFSAETQAALDLQLCIHSMDASGMATVVRHTGALHTAAA